MKTLETTATVTEDRHLTARAPASWPHGEHRVVIVLDETPVLTPPTRRMPDMKAFRAKLGLSTCPGNSVVEMREEEKS